MKIKTKNFKVNDAGKLDVELIHDFYPLEEYPDVKLVCEHIRNAEMSKYISADDKSFDMEKMFRQKVKSVEGITIEDEEGREIVCNVDTLIRLPNPTFSEIISSTCVHLIQSYTLTEAERKN